METRGEPDSTARLVADRHMLYSTLNDAWRQAWWKRPFYVMAAWRYYRIIRALGAENFKLRTDEKEIETLTEDQLWKEAVGLADG